MAMRKKKERKREQGEWGPAIYVSISWRARVRRDSHLGWTADGESRETRPPAGRVRGLLRPSDPANRCRRVGVSEDAPGDPTPFQASALLRHSRVMLLDPGDPRG